jgi:hypothetical protein
MKSRIKKIGEIYRSRDVTLNYLQDYLNNAKTIGLRYESMNSRLIKAVPGIILPNNLSEIISIYSTFIVLTRNNLKTGLQEYVRMSCGYLNEADITNTQIGVINLSSIGKLENLSNETNLKNASNPTGVQISKINISKKHSWLEAKLAGELNIIDSNPIVKLANNYIGQYQYQFIDSKDRPNKIIGGSYNLA